MVLVLYRWCHHACLWGVTPGPWNLNVIGVLNRDTAGESVARISRIAASTRHLQICVTFGVLEITFAVLPKKGDGILKISEEQFYVICRYKL